MPSSKRIKEIKKKYTISTMDVLIAVSIVLFGFYHLLLTKEPADNNKKIVIYKGSTILKQLRIDTDNIINLDAYGISMQVEVANQKIRVLSSSCKRQICVQKGWIHNVRDAIICIPNDIIIEITGETSEYDAISH